jgi:CheY-like chemotaxis protein
MEIADVLTEAGYRVIAETCADHALAVLGIRSDIRVLFTDVALPGKIDGCALARIVDDRWRDIGILVTASGLRPAPHELPSKARFVTKPCSGSLLIQEVNAFLAEGSGAITVTFEQQNSAIEPSTQFLPAGIKINQPHTGIGSAGGLAQPPQEPEK